MNEQTTFENTCKEVLDFKEQIHTTNNWIYKNNLWTKTISPQEQPETAKQHGDSLRTDERIQIAASKDTTHDPLTTNQDVDSANSHENEKKKQRNTSRGY